VSGGGRLSVCGGHKGSATGYLFFAKSLVPRDTLHLSAWSMSLNRIAKQADLWRSGDGLGQYRGFQGEGLFKMIVWLERRRYGAPRPDNACLSSRSAGPGSDTCWTHAVLGRSPFSWCECEDKAGTLQYFVESRSRLRTPKSNRNQVDPFEIVPSKSGKKGRMSVFCLVNASGTYVLNYCHRSDFRYPPVLMSVVWLIA